MQGVKYDETVVIEKIKEKLSSKNMEFVGFNGEYKSTRKTKANVRCNVCGYEDKLPVDSILNRSFGCKKCNKHAPMFYESDLKKKCESMGYEFIGFVDGEYKNGKSKLIYKCGKCGKIVNVNSRNFMKDCYRGCCTPKQHLSSKEYLDKLKKICEENNYEILSIGDEEGTIGVRTRVKYRCNICGNITETDIGHIVNEGTRCPGCRGGAKINPELVLKRIEERCNELDCTFIKFLNNENKYKNNLTRVLLGCKTCGYKWDASYAHFIRDTGCPKCGGSELLTNEEAIERALERGKESNITVYGFVDGEYKNNTSRLKLICNECGYEWDMAYANFVYGKGCPSCCGHAQPTTEEWIDRAKQVHGDKYDYSKTEYKGSKENLCIICREHGEFWQLPYVHLQGGGCPFCEGSNLEKMVRSFLESKNILFEQQKGFEWLRFRNPMKLDFYLPNNNAAIECQGGQHFYPVDYFGGESSFKETVIRDELKRKLCEKNGIKIFYYSNLGIKYPYQVYEDFDEMIKDIKHYSYFKNLEEMLCEANAK